MLITFHLFGNDMTLFSKIKPNNRTLTTISATAIRHVTPNIWTPTQLLKISPAAESLYNITIDVSDSPHLVNSYTSPGQYLQLRLRKPNTTRHTFLAIASPPDLKTGVFEFLVKCISGSVAEMLCKSREGDVVELSRVMGKGFDVGRIEDCDTVFVFATGSGISPIRSLIESGFGADRRSDVRLYYGARNLSRMAYQERFKDWESSGVNILPVLSQPHDSWAGYRGFIQAAFAREKRILNPQSTGAILCGHKQMAEEVTSILVSDGVSGDKILKNI